MPTTTIPAFDFGELKRAIEERDRPAQLALDAPDAEVTIVDRIHTPGAPRVLRGREESRIWLEDVCERDMTHQVDMQVLGDSGALMDTTFQIVVIWHLDGKTYGPVANAGEANCTASATGPHHAG